MRSAGEDPGSEKLSQSRAEGSDVSLGPIPEGRDKHFWGPQQ